MAGIKNHRPYKNRWQLKAATLQEYNRARSEAYRQAVYEIIIDQYGSKCTCCGELEKKFLTIDHMNNDGHLDKVGGYRRSAYSMKLKIIREGFPDKYELRCYNCNLGRAANKGVCPHAS